MDSIKYYKHRKSNYRLIVFSIISMFLWIYLFFSERTEIKIVSLVFIALSIYLITKSLLNKSTVSVDEYGVRTRVNGIGLVPWNYIEGFEIKKLYNSTGITVLMNDQDAFIETKKKVTQLLMRTNIKKLDSPVVIPKQEFNKSLEDVLLELEEMNNAFNNNVSK